LPDDPGPWRLIRIGAGENAERISDLARSADYTILIAPETSGILARLTRDLRQAGARNLGSTAEAVELTGNKARLAEWIQSLGIDTPLTRTIDPSIGLPADTVYPAVLKPLDGAGSVDTFYLSNAQSLPEDARTLAIALLQPFVAGVPMSASFLAGADGRAWLIGMGRQRMAIKNGRFQYRGGTIPAPCPDGATQLRGSVESITGLHGYVGVDFIWDPDRRHITLLEINPRPTTSYVGLSRILPAGLLARAWLEACAPTVRGANGYLVSLAETVHGQSPISFDAEGMMISIHEGILP
jgi:predicted ATP-grasp superfamily ATP-dependent carboligase